MKIKVDFGGEKCASKVLNSASGSPKSTPEGDPVSPELGEGGVFVYV